MISQDTLVVTGSGYQAIATPVRVDVAGLTVITGPSNTGKTALLRLILGIIQGQLGTDFLTVDQTEVDATLTVTHDTVSHTARWIKGKTTQYVIDGRVYHNAGRDRPQTLACLGFQEIVSGNRSYFPQVQRQFDSPFLSRETPAVAADLLAPGRDHAVARYAVALGHRKLQEGEGESRLLARFLAEDRSRVDRQQAQVANLEARRQEAQREGETYTRCQADRIRLEEVAHQYRQTWIEAESLTVPLVLPQAIEDLESVAWEKLAAQWETVVSRLAGEVSGELPAVPEPGVADSWRDLETSWITNQQELDQLDQEESQLHDLLVQVESEIRVTLAALGRCPLCGETV